MNIEVGMAILIAISMILSWLIFGRINSGKSDGFICWLKSTVFTAGVLLGWLLYKEPSVGLWAALAISTLISAVANLARSQWVFLFP